MGTIELYTPLERTARTPFGRARFRLADFGRLKSRLALWRRRARERRELRTLDERLRRDIGIHAADAAREANKPFWKA